MDAAAVRLGGIEGEIGIADQRLRIATVIGGDGDADRTADGDRGPAQAIGHGRACDQLGRQRRQRVAALRAGQQHLELVAAQSPDQPRIADAARQALRHLLQQIVAGLWPSVSLTALNRSRSIRNIALGRPPPCACASVLSIDSRIRWRLARPVSPSNSASRVISASDRRRSVRSVPEPMNPEPAQLVDHRPADIDHQRSPASSSAARTE